jgi:hypothetical protein
MHAMVIRGLPLTVIEQLFTAPQSSIPLKNLCGGSAEGSVKVYQPIGCAEGAELSLSGDTSLADAVALMLWIAESQSDQFVQGLCYANDLDFGVVGLRKNELVTLRISYSNLYLLQEEYALAEAKGPGNPIELAEEDIDLFEVDLRDGLQNAFISALSEGDLALEHRPLFKELAAANGEWNIDSRFCGG